jgi:hypothetical protein
VISVVAGKVMDGHVDAVGGADGYQSCGIIR